jgi:hypothetical protein
MALTGNNGGGGNGPQSGSTPDNYSDLHNNGDNPFSGGSPAVDGSEDTNTPFRAGSLPGYFQNPPAMGGNPYSGGAPDQYGPANDADMGAGVDNAYRETLGNQRDTYDWTVPNALDYYIDNGAGFDEAVPLDEQR